jgi:hypothetical protein
MRASRRSSTSTTMPQLHSQRMHAVGCHVIAAAPFL